MGDRERMTAVRPLGPVPDGAGIVNLAWAGTGVFAAAAAAGAADPDTFAVATAVVSCVLFAVGCAVFLWAYALAVGRSRSDSIGIGGLYFLAGDTAPRPVRTRLMIALAVQVVVAVAAASLRPFTPIAFGILVPMFGLGLAGLWGARHGEFPSNVATGRPSGARADGSQ
ncbi:hypothetical protein BH18ACT4_BH18ACT4_10820 [soil metagenome]